MGATVDGRRLNPQSPPLQLKAAEFAERCQEYQMKIDQLKGQHHRDMETARQELKGLYAEVRRRGVLG